MFNVILKDTTPGSGLELYTTVPVIPRVHEFIRIPDIQTGRSDTYYEIRGVVYAGEMIELYIERHISTFNRPGDRKDIPITVQLFNSTREAAKPKRR